MRRHCEIVQDAIRHAQDGVNEHDTKIKLMQEYTNQLVLELIDQGKVNIPHLGQLKLHWTPQGEIRVIYIVKHNLMTAIKEALT